MIRIERVTGLDAPTGGIVPEGVQEVLHAWIIESLEARGGRATVVDVCKHIWRSHEEALRDSGDLFYTWQWDIRWAAVDLRGRGVLRQQDESPSGVWELTRAAGSADTGVWTPGPSAPTPDRRSLSVLLTDAQRWLAAAEQTNAGGPGTGLAHAHALVFSHLDPGGSRPAEIARRAGITRQAVGQTVREMCSLGLIDLVTDPTNRRARLARATAEGRRALERDAVGASAAEDLLSRRIGAARVWSLRHALEVVGLERNHQTDPTELADLAAAGLDDLPPTLVVQRLAEAVCARGRVDDAELSAALADASGIQVPETQRSLIGKLAAAGRSLGMLDFDEDTGVWTPGPSAPTPDRRSLSVLLTDAQRWLAAAEQTNAGGPGTGLAHAHALVFSHLDPGGSRPAEIARRAGITRQAVGQTVREMCSLGLIDLVTDPTNRRARLARATAEGRRALERDAVGASAAEDLLSRRIGAARVWSLREALEQDWGAPV